MMKIIKTKAMGLLGAMAIAVALNLASAESAVAMDFTINVPVRVTNMLAGTQLTAFCYVFTSAPSATSIDNGLGTSVGTGSASQHIYPNEQSGNAFGTITAQFNANPGKDPATATHYGCWLQITGPGAGGLYYPPGPNHNSVWGRPKPGTTFTPFVSGPLPQ